MKAVKVETDGSIKLPKQMLRLFPTSTELAVWTEGDTIVLKRLQPLKPSQIAERVPENGASCRDIAALNASSQPFLGLATERITRWSLCASSSTVSSRRHSSKSLLGMRMPRELPMRTTLVFMTQPFPWMVATK